MRDDDDDANDDPSSSSVDEPEHLLCPITRAMFRDPVFVPASGNTYERDAVARFWSATSRARDPLTNATLRSRSVYTNWDKRREVADWLTANPTTTPSGWASRTPPAPEKWRDGPERDREGESTVGRRTMRAVINGGVMVKVVAVAALTAAAWSAAGWSAGAGGFGTVWPRSGTSGSPRMPPIDEFGVVEDLSAPAGSRVRVRRVKTGPTPALEIVVPAQSVDTASLLFSVPWFAITGTWTYGAWNAANPLFASFSIPFWAVGVNMLHQGATSAFENARLLVTADRFYLEKVIFDRRMFFLRGNTADLSKAAVETYAYVNGKPQSHLVVHHGIKSHVLARGLHPSEDDFIVDQLTTFLKKHRRGNARGDEKMKIESTTPLLARSRM